MKPEPIRTLSRLALAAGVLLAIGHVIFGGDPFDVAISWFMIAVGGLLVLVWAAVQKWGSERQRAEFPAGRRLVRQMRDDLRPVKLWLGRTWQNIGGW